MGIIFKKNGRPRKAEKATLKNINTFLGSLDEAEKSKYNFDGETVTDANRLDEIWQTINENQKAKNKNIEQVGNANVDTQTGEILSENEKVEKEETNFVNKEEPMEDANILEEMAEEGGGNAGNVEEVPSFFNPLEDAVKQRSYQKTEQTDVGDIPEPNLGSTKTVQDELDEINDEAENQEEIFEEEEEEEQGSGLDDLTNPAMNDLDPKDRKLASKQLVQTVLDGYEMLHELGKNFVKYPEEKLQEKVMKGEIDPTMEIPLDEMGNTTNPVEFFQNFNQQAEEAISYDPEFGEKVRPAMERVFSKRGWGMTDEQYLMVAFGKDIGWKGVQIMNLRKTAKGIMNTFEQLQREKIESQERMRREEMRSRPINPDSITTPPKQEQPPKQEYQQTQEEVVDDGNRGYYGSNEEEISNEVVPIHG